MKNIRQDTIAAGAPARRLGVFVMLPLMAGLMVLCALSWEWRSSLRVKRVVIEGSSILPAQQIFALAAFPMKAPLTSLNLRSLEERILKNPFIRSATVTREYPDAIRIAVAERRPVASLSCGQLWYVDAEGVILPYLQSPVKLDLPVIDGIAGMTKPQAGDTLPGGEVSQALSVLQLAQEVDSSMLHAISEINMNGGKDIILYSTDIAVPIILGRGDFGKKFVLLESFWKNFVKTENAANLQYIDLRYDDQVVVKWLNEGPRQSKASL